MATSTLVIGAGFGGLAAALRLRARGHEVTIVDRQPQPGGRAAVHRRGGFTFDAGPTIITAPFLIHELFELFGRRTDEYVELRALEPWYRLRFDDGRNLDFTSDLDAMLQQVRSFEPRDVEGYRRMLDATRRIYEVGFERLGDQPFHELKTMLGVLPSLIALRSDRSVYRQTSRFVRDPQLRQAFSFHPLLVGGNPFTTTSIYSLIHYLERNDGVHFAMGGTTALVAAMVRLLEEEGVTLHLGRTVEEILVDGSPGGGRRARAAGVRLDDGEMLRADRIVANADAPFVYRELVPAAHRRRWSDRRIERMKYSMGLFVLYFGSRRTYPHLAHHEILLGPRYRGLLEEIFDRKTLAPDVSLYLHAPTRTDSSLAPPGCESMYALVPVPNLRGATDWSQAGPTLRDRVVERLSSTVCPGLENDIVEDFFVTPEHFRDGLLSHHGAGFSVQPMLHQSAWFRFHNRSEELRDLYLVGAGTHPGAGLPGVLTSAKVLDRLLDAEDETGAAGGERAARSVLVGAQDDSAAAPKRGRFVARAREDHAGVHDRTPPVEALDAEPAAALMARRAKTFTWAAYLLPRSIRADVATLYRFCRVVDDLADDLEDPAEGLRWMLRVGDDLERGDSMLEPVADFLDLARRRGIPVDYARELVRGLRTDLDIVRVASRDDLLRYCYQVASTVGVMMCRVLGTRAPDAPLYAIDLGIAMQLTNIARDVGEDLAAGRIYLPASWVAPETVIAAVGHRDAAASMPVYAAVERLLDLAHDYYRSADVGIALLPARARWSILTASRSYEAIGSRIREQGPGYWHGRAHTTRAHKLVQSLRSVTVLAARGLSDSCAGLLGIEAAPRRHRERLHRPLASLPTSALWRGLSPAGSSDA
ncbi:MAG: phytoene desaturase family protein [Acidobacteriota bacterium]